mmetsp:Transcript_25738/g.84731  ORF Transcript_25738/g.84731 Transcript_25738/m.84731 type:complete len:215 (+) Transcript_25738:15-659(+)
MLDNLDTTAVNAPKFIVLGVSFWLALLAFSCLSNQTQGLYGPDHETYSQCVDGCGYNMFSEFQYLVGINVIYWLTTMSLMGMTLLRFALQPSQEFLLHVVFSLLIFSGFCAAATACDEHVVDDDTKVCHEAHNALAGVTFSFFLWLGTIVSSYFAWHEWRDTRFDGIPDHISNPVKEAFFPPGSGPPGPPPGGFPSNAYPPAPISVPASTQTYA